MKPSADDNIRNASLPNFWKYSSAQKDVNKEVIEPSAPQHLQTLSFHDLRKEDAAPIILQYLESGGEEIPFTFLGDLPRQKEMCGAWN